MDDIEKGFDQLLEMVEEMNRKNIPLLGEVREKAAALLAKMGKTTVPVVQRIGMTMVDRAKLDGKGEPYDAQYHPRKMIVLGKSEPAPYRPDDPGKKVTDQFCVLSEDGNFYEIMYSTDGMFLDSYLNPLTPEQVLDIYGLEVMFMLYRAMRDYLEDQKDLVDALGRVLDYIKT
ncbi:MAG: hypothetical protein LUO86_03660 [Methanomicrobiales archaeon]|nr:hypothetical protein [Methanomicrobiales archaeon]MDD1654208.1 hypothetical protein [Methanomicrobiales archaeon]